MLKVRTVLLTVPCSPPMGHITISLTLTALEEQKKGLVHNVRAFFAPPSFCGGLDIIMLLLIPTFTSRTFSKQNLHLTIILDAKIQKPFAWGTHTITEQLVPCSRIFYFCCQYFYVHVCSIHISP